MRTSPRVRRDEDPPTGAAAPLSILVAALMLAASGGGLLRPSVYRDNPLVTAGWLGNDLVTVVFAVPVLLLLARRTSPRARLIRAGALAYAVYDFAFYLFGAALNRLFLVYAAIVALALVGLGFAIAEIPRETLSAPPRGTARGVAAFTAGVATMLGGFWVAVSFAAELTGRAPAIVAATGAHTNVVAALDLSLVVPSGVLAALWLGRRRARGLVLAVIWNVQGALYMAALAAATVTAWHAGQMEGPGQATLWAVLGLGCLGSSAILLRPLGTAGTGESPQPAPAAARRSYRRSSDHAPEAAGAASEEWLERPGPRATHAISRTYRNLAGPASHAGERGIPGPARRRPPRGG